MYWRLFHPFVSDLGQKDPIAYPHIYLSFPLFRQCFNGNLLLCISMTGQLSADSCRYPAEVLDSCQVWCRNWPIESYAQRFPGCVTGRLSACSRVPHGESKSMEELPFLVSGSETDEGVVKDKNCPDPGIKPTRLYHFMGMMFTYQQGGTIKQ